jgi:predicted membrane protein
MNTRHGRITPHLVVGLVVITLGVLLTLDNLRIIDAQDYYSYWPLVLIFVGVAKLGSSMTRTAQLIAGLWIAVGVAFLLSNLDMLRFRIWEFWPVGLVLLGVTMLRRSTQRHQQTVSAADPSSTVSAICVWSGADRKVTSTDFRGGELTAIMGGVEVDLSHARIANGEAIMDVFALWGGIDIKVPPDWTVVGDVTPFMGAYEDSRKSPTAGDPAQRLVLRGMVVMGGVEVSN